jgi:DNA processing protein
VDPIEDGDLAAWLRLVGTPGVGRGTARVLLARFGPPRQVLAQSRAALRGVVGEALADALLDADDEWEAAAAAVRAWLEGDASRHVLTLDDPRFPRALLDTADPPLMLYAQGRLDRMEAPSIAIVGSRHATPQGRDNARAFARALGNSGWTIVSGMALGVDGAAHEGALETPCSTIAVVGTGIDRIYPARHEQMARRIAETGLLLSELPMGTPPLRENFPQRNRIIAGLTRGTLVVEAALQSGSLITARLANESGREVFAIPGSIHSPQSRGCHALIKQGAKLVETAQDVLDELRGGHAWQRVDSDGAAGASIDDAQALVGNPDGRAVPALAPRDVAIVDAMGFDPVGLDAILDRTGLDTATVQARLLDLELEGHVQRMPGGRFQRRSRG